MGGTAVLYYCGTVPRYFFSTGTVGTSKKVLVPQCRYFHFSIFRPFAKSFTIINASNFAKSSIIKKIMKKVRSAQLHLLQQSFERFVFKI